MAEGLAELAVGYELRGWVVVNKLGEGGFGAVYRVRNAVSGELAAMKVEGVNERTPVLKMEVLVLEGLQKEGKKHICQLLCKGRNAQFSYLIMTLVGPSLQDLKKLKPSNHLSLSSALRVGIQCLEALKDLHGIKYLHRDVKPGNFAIGREEVREHRNIFILDFGMARKFVNESGEYKTPREKAGFRGTIRYAPISCHLKQEVGRKDDLEVWFYQQVEITVGRLPWRELTSVTAVGEMKQSSRKDGALFAGCPPEYQGMITYIDSVHVVEKPDYTRIGRHLVQVMSRTGVKMEDPYDWEVMRTQRESLKQPPPP